MFFEGDSSSAAATNALMAAMRDEIVAYAGESDGDLDDAELESLPALIDLGAEMPGLDR
jgi:hypothetical protein